MTGYPDRMSSEARDAVRRAQAAVERAERCIGGDALADALSATTEALNAAAGILERSPDPRVGHALYAGWYLRDAAAVVWDATQRHRYLDEHGRDPVRFDVTAVPLDMARRALLAAAYALDAAGLRAWPADAPIGYTVAAPNVSTADVLEALTHGHEAVFYRSAIARDGLDAVAAQEIRDMIDGGHLLASEDEAEREAGDVLDRDPTRDPRVLTITAEDIAEHLVRLGWNEPAPRRLSTGEGPEADT